ncbi:2-(1,2-epoxy-1,2-dihydrophenyl)acetyl-CoA isomerase [Streptomyces mashuensis]|uniref:2-(1,2-epoxy-1,2-dihydrophenyl)acetyl-CoA isomerase n=1 Tax=Streptomyces mashuensis TaxID=33904 RepID=A0A919B5W4_9ACTN|nr:enoyl-CoA hydratase-related protein [Streptomyces mashuensis]GHF57952.1 2-(1,2-epoxy-1,2-dihydrophenyl)acetyl-CoA isomerase [Streptomyces mashuensis]
MNFSPRESSPTESGGHDGQAGTEERDDAATPSRPTDSWILHATDNGVAWITLNRPRVLNALAPDQRDSLISLFSRASADHAVRAVVLTGAGKGFCAGADLRTAPASQAVAARPPGEVARLIKLGAQRLISAVLDCEKPVIAAVNGVAAGLGAHLAWACDLVLAAESARFTEVFVRRGLVPDGGGTYLLPRLVGPRRAKELMFFGDALGAAEAERFGLVNRVVPDEELPTAARAWAQRLANGPTQALSLTKQLVNASLDVGRAPAFAAEAAAQEINAATADAAEGIAAFVERRPPEFRGC